MTLAATYTPAKYDCDGSTTQFPFQHPFFEVTDLVVYVIDDTGIVSTLVYGSGAGKYTISATNNDFSSGATIITGSTYDEGYRLVIERSVPYGQQLDINGDFVPAEPLEQQLDKLAAQIQQIKEELNRTVVCPVSDSPGLTYEIGSETERAGKALGFDSEGNVTELSIATEGGAFTAVDTNKGLSSSGGTIAGKVDDSTLAFSSGNFAVKAGGIGATQLANASIATTKLASPTGTDTNVVTGTKGTSGNLVKWDANGDAVDSTFGVIDEDDMSSDSATDVPTQQSVKAYVDSEAASASADVAMKFYTSTGTAVYTGTIKTTGTDIDLSSIVGAQRVFCLMEAYSTSTTARDVLFKTKGSPYIPYAGSNNGIGAIVISTNNGAHFAVITDSSGIITGISLGGDATNCVVKLIGYQVLQ